MKRAWKGWLVAGLGVILVVGAIGCQEDGAPAASALAPQGGAEAFLGAGGPMPLLHRLDRKLNLTDSQHAAVKAILQREREAMKAAGVFQQGHDAVRAALEARRDKVADEIATLLTPEQQATFTAMRARLKERLAGGVGHGEVLTRELGLSPAQQEQLKALMAERRASFQEMRAELRAAAGNKRTAWRERARAEHEAFRTKLEAFLTPEQQAHFRQLVEEWRKDFRE